MKTNLLALTMFLALALPFGLHAEAASALAADPIQTIRITAKKFEYSPSEIELRQGEPVLLELISLDRLHGFNCPDLGVRADIVPGTPTTIRVEPKKAGRLVFRCDIYCGDGHEEMEGAFIVKGGQ